MSLSKPKFRLEALPGVNGFPPGVRIVMDEPLLIRLAAHLRRRLLNFRQTRHYRRRATRLVLPARYEVHCDKELL